MEAHLRRHASYSKTPHFAAYALLLLPGGRLVDRFGHRRVAIAGLALFACAGASGALAGSLGALIASRLLQRVGAGLVSPAALAGAVSGLPRDRRDVALGIWGASAGVANLAGLLLGGAITVTFGWRARLVGTRACGIGVRGGSPK